MKRDRRIIARNFAHEAVAAAIAAARRAIGPLRAGSHGALDRPLSRQPGGKHQLAAYGQRTYSQGGEDGILRELFYRVGSGNKYFVEFGVGDGSECNTRLLAERYGWRGLYIEADAADAKLVRERWSRRPDLTVREAFLTAQTVAVLFAEAGVPLDLDLLSIDVDGNDYWIWQALAAYRARVVVVEYNAAYPPPIDWIIEYRADHRYVRDTTYFGASLTALSRLADRLGYALLDTDSNGTNAFFLRNDLLLESGLRAVSPESAYHKPRYGRLRVPHRFLAGPSVSSAGSTP